MPSNTSIILHCFLYKISNPTDYIVSTKLWAMSLHILGFAPEIINACNSQQTIHIIFENFALTSVLIIFPHHCVTVLPNLVDIAFSGNFFVSYQLLYNKSSSN